MEQLATQDNKVSALGVVNITSDQVELVKTIVFPTASDDELKLYFFECRRRGVHPLDRLVIPVKRGGKVSFQTSIDLFRSQAEETGEYRGQEDIEYGPMIDQDKIDKKVPEWAKATVLRYDAITGQITKVSSFAYWEEYYPGDDQGFQWRKMPRLMLGKCAEALALRKAFPRKLAGLYTFEEMELTDLVSSGTPKNKPPVKQPKEKAPDNSDIQTALITVSEVRKQAGTNKKTGKPYTKYTVIDGEGNQYGTFSETSAQYANDAAGSGVELQITYKVTQYGNDLESIGLPPDEGQE